MKYVIGVIAIGMCVGSAVTRAETKESPKEKWQVTQIYLHNGALDPSTALPPPPARDSTEDRMDVAKLLQLQKTRTARQCDRAQTEAHITLDSFFGPKYGPLSAQEVQTWSPFFTKILTDTDYYVHKVKELWSRPRPYLSHPEINPCIKREGTKSYPSGHAAISRVWALTLDQIDPTRKKMFDARANQIADDRVLGGVHHPSDIEEGKRLGDEIFAAFSRNPQFERDLITLRGSVKLHE